MEIRTLMAYSLILAIVLLLGAMAAFKWHFSHRRSYLRGAVKANGLRCGQ